MGLYFLAILLFLNKLILVPPLLRESLNNKVGVIEGTRLMNYNAQSQWRVAYPSKSWSKRGGTCYVDW